jgi:hypothetical protein
VKTNHRASSHKICEHPIKGRNCNDRGLSDDIAVAATPENEMDLFTIYSLKIPRLVCVNLKVSTKAGQEYRNYDRHN